MQSDHREHKLDSSRWLGLRSYEEQDASLFYGRQAEVEKLFRMIRRNILTTVFAPSGTGKTSLLRAGLFPKLRANNFLPVWIRLDHSSESQSHAAVVRERLNEAAVGAGLELDAIVSPQFGATESLWEYLHRVELWNADNDLVTPVLVFDQFEEVFTIGEGRPQTESFLSELADIVEKRIPHEVRERLNASERKLEIPLDAQGFRIVFSLRQDFVARLDDFRKKMPSLMRNRYPLHHLNGNQALEVVLGPGKDVVSERVAQKIVSIVAGHSETDLIHLDFDKLQVEPNHLSLLCHELDLQRLRDGKPTIEANELVEQSQGILRRFYEQSLADVTASAKVFIEDNLLTSSGFRKAQPIDDAESMGLTRLDLEKLIDRHVLRIDDRKDIQHIELTHDLLTSVVQESRDRRHLEEEKQTLLKARMADMRKRQVYGIVSVVLLGLFFVAVFMAFKSHASAQRAQAAEAVAEKNQARTEALLSYMTNDLYGRLLQIGRTDLLESIAREAESFYSSQMDANSGNDAELLSRVQALHRVANVLSKRGYSEEALRSFEMAEALILRWEDKQKSARNDAIELSHAMLLVDWSKDINRWGNPKRALQMSKKGVQLLENTGEDGGLTRGYAYLSRADIFYEQGDYAKSESLLNEFVPHRCCDDKGNKTGNAMAPRQAALTAKFWDRAGRICFVRGQFKDAFKHYRASLKVISELVDRSPENSEWVRYKCTLLKRIGDLHVALGDLEGARDKYAPVLSIVSKEIEKSVSTRDSQGHSAPLWRKLASEINCNLAKCCERNAESYADVDRRTGLIDEALSRLLAALGEASKLPRSFEARLLQARTLLEISGFLLINESTVSGLGRPNDLRAMLQSVEATCRSPDVRDIAESCLDRSNQMFDSFHADVADEESPALLFAQAESLFLFTKQVEGLESESIAVRRLQKVQALLDRAIRAADGWIAALHLQAESGLLLAAFTEEMGLTNQSIEILRSAQRSCQTICEVDDPEDMRIRLLGKIQYQLGNLIDWSEHTKEATQESVSLFREARNCSLHLCGEDQAYLADRLKLAETEFRLAKLLGRIGREEESLAQLKSSSSHGWAAATRLLMDQGKTTAGLAELPSHEELSQRSVRQQTQNVELGWVLVDEVQNGTRETIERPVKAEIIVTGPQVDRSFEESSIHSEIERVRQQLNLRLPEETEKNLKTWFSSISQDPMSRLNLAELTELGIESEQETTDDQLSLRESEISLRSPVERSYPSRTPAVIGQECLFSWHFRGTERDLRSFQLQVSRDEQFSEENLVIDRRVDGTSYRHVFGSSQNVPNQTVYWRVRRVGSSASSSDIDFGAVGEWCPIRTVELYDSVLSRIRKTRTLRVGISEYEGDLLTWEKNDLTPQNFDGAVIEHLRSYLSSIIEEEGTEDANTGQLKVQPYRYSWLEMFHAVSRNEVDIAISAITRTREREKRFKISFSEPYYETQFVVMTSSQNKLHSLDDIRKMKLRLEATEGMRWGEISSIVAPQHQVVKLTYPKLDVLFGRPVKDSNVATLSDYAFVHKHLAANPEDREQLSVLTLSEQDFQSLLDRALTDESNEYRVDDVRRLFRDYGGAANEQYAVGLSLDATELKQHINQAILEFRRDSAKQVCVESGIPVATRLYGKDQIAEDVRHRATVIPEYPSPQSRSGTVLGDSIKFEWYPVRNEALSFRFQLAKRGEFFASNSIIIDRLTNTPQFEFELPEGFPAAHTLYWRAKVIDPTLEEPSADPFPEDGWCKPIKIMYFRNCLERIKHDGKLRVALNISNGDSVFRDQDGAIKGFDVEIAKLLASDLSSSLAGSRVEFVPAEMRFTDMLPSVRNYQADIAISGITATRDREKKFNIKFSLPYCQTRQAAIWRQSDTIENVRQARGKRFIVFEQTRAVDIEKAFSPSDNIIQIRSNPNYFLLEQLLSDNADVTVLDHPAAAKIVREYSASDKFFVAPIGAGDLPETADVELVDDYAIAVHEDQVELLKQVNQTITRLRSGDSETSLSEIFERYQSRSEPKTYDVSF